MTTSYEVVPNVAGLARHPTFVRFPVPNGEELSLRTTRFDPRAGFDVDEAGNIIIDADPNNISLVWEGQDETNSAIILVERGAIVSWFNGSAGRVTVRKDRADRTLFEVMDSARVSQVACASGSAGDFVQRLVEKKKLADETIDALVAPKYYLEIDVAFMYTDQALIQVGGTVAGFDQYANMAIEEVNSALSNTYSASHIHLRRVGPMVRVDYNESPQQSNSTLRYQLHRKFMTDRRFDDGTLGADIIGTRQTYLADLVVLFVADQGTTAFPGGPWGIAVTQRQNCMDGIDTTFCTPGPSYGDVAFIVANPLKGIVNYTLAHELGHAMGSEHDLAGGQVAPWPAAIPPSNTIASFAHSYGFRAGVGGSTGRGDIMTSPECIPSNNAANCWTRDRQFADPNRQFLTLAATAGQTTPGNPNTAYGYNALTFRKLAEGTASFYRPVGVAPYEQPFFWDGFEQ